jgi:hypothetical protein
MKDLHPIDADFFTNLYQEARSERGAAGAGAVARI